LGCFLYGVPFFLISTAINQFIIERLRKKKNLLIASIISIIFTGLFYYSVCIFINVKSDFLVFRLCMIIKAFVVLGFFMGVTRALQKVQKDGAR